MKKILAIDSKMPNSMINEISKLGYDIFKVCPNCIFDSAISSHPDMNFLQFGSRTYALSNTNARFSDLNICKIESKQQLTYPNDVLLNAAVVGNDLICRAESLYSDAYKYAKEKSICIVDVKQGYAKCNIVPVCGKNKAVITEDEGMANKLRNIGYDVLLLKNKCVRLKPYKYGFIGGASGVIDNMVVFTGKIETHPEYKHIYNFCKRYNKSVVSLSDDELYDYGSILPLTVDD